MRLPISKVYRAFPELDAFSDDECEAFVGRAKNDYGGSMGLTFLVTGFALVIAWIIGVALADIGWTQIVPYLQRGRNNFQVGDMKALIGIGLLTLGVFGSCLVFLAVRDRWLIRTISKKVRQARCPTCEYSLLGLTIETGAVRCPECARLVYLHEMGLTPEDLIAPLGVGPRVDGRASGRGAARP